jgi:phage/plasmid primase-like uncharacterized protein
MKVKIHSDRRQSLDAAQRAFCEHIASSLSGDAPSHGAVISDGEWHRFRVSGDKRGEESGTYKQYGDSPYNGLYRCHRRGITEKWSPKTDRGDSSPAEREKYRKRVAENERKRERKTEAAARRAERIWAEAKPAMDAHQYLVKKRIKPHGIRVGDDGRLIVPVYGQDGKLASLQFISATGKKLFLGGAAAGGGYYLIGEIDESTTKILVAEGFATAATLHEATGWPVVVAFNADNLLKVAPWLHKLHSGALIVICADDDRWKPEKGNPGLTKGREAASAIGAVLAVPDTTGIEGTPTDFNDVYIARGLDEVRLQIETAIEQESERAERQDRADAEPLPELPPFDVPTMSGEDGLAILREIVKEYFDALVQHVATRKWRDARLEELIEEAEDQRDEPLSEEDQKRERFRLGMKCEPRGAEAVWQV